MKDSSEEKYTHIGIIMPNDGLICGKHYFIMFNELLPVTICREYAKYYSQNLKPLKRNSLNKRCRMAKYQTEEAEKVVELNFREVVRVFYFFN